MAPGQPRPNALGLAFVAIGDRWNLLILREALEGARHFRDWGEALGISDPVLSTRLRDLTAVGLLEREVPGGYRLTEAGRAIWPVLVAIWMWDQRWTGDPDPQAFAGRPRLRHLGCGFVTHPLLSCSACGACGVTPAETSVDMRPEYSYDDLNPARAYRRSTPARTGELGATELLGDRWSTSVLSAALLGARRFQDFVVAIETIAPAVLSERLARFVDQGVLDRRPVAAGGRRMEYRLSAKGLDFFGVLATAIAWAGASFGDPDGGHPTTIRHRPCGRRFEPVLVCNACSDRLVGHLLRVERPPR